MLRGAGQALWTEDRTVVNRAHAVLLVAVELSSEGMSTQEERMLQRVRSGGGL